jgi:DisA bacterial checkpoint controller nucleotide-binding
MNDACERQIFAETISSLLETGPAGELYSQLNGVALLRYEDSQESSFLALCRADHPALSRRLIVEAPVRMQDASYVRKMLNISSPSLAVLSDGLVIFGFGSVPSGRGALVVRFDWPGMWELLRDGQFIMRAGSSAKDDRMKALRKDQFQIALEQAFGPLPPSTAERLWQLILAATRQGRGTNVLISADAFREAARLSSQCTRVVPFELTSAVMERATAIDGTVVMDPNGICHAIGAILDGAVSRRGSPARGGRFNSALMYLDSCPSPALIVVVSQDGMVDLVTKQMP